MLLFAIVHRHDIALSHPMPPHVMRCHLVRSHSESQSDDFQKMILYVYVYTLCGMCSLYCIPSCVFIFLSFTCHTLIECNASVNGKKMPQKHDHLKHFIQIIIRKRAKEQYRTRCYERLEFQFIKKKSTSKSKNIKSEQKKTESNYYRQLHVYVSVCVLLLLFIFIVKPELRTPKQQKTKRRKKVQNPLKYRKC